MAAKDVCIAADQTKDYVPAIPDIEDFGGVGSSFFSEDDDDLFNLAAAARPKLELHCGPETGTSQEGVLCSGTLAVHKKYTSLRIDAIRESAVYLERGTAKQIVRGARRSNFRC